MCASGHLLNPVSKPRSEAEAGSDIHASPTFAGLSCTVKKTTFPVYSCHSYTINTDQLHTININSLPGFLLDGTNQFPVR